MPWNNDSSSANASAAEADKSVKVETGDDVSGNVAGAGTNEDTPKDNQKKVKTGQDQDVEMQTATRDKPKASNESASESKQTEAEVEAEKMIRIEKLRLAQSAHRKRVVYYHHDELSIFEHGRSHPRRPFRGKLAHSLIMGLGIYSEYLEPLRPRLVSMTDFGQFHSDNYVSILRFVQEYMNPVIKERAWLNASPTIAEGEDVQTWEKIASTLKRFNLGLGADSVNSAMPGLLDYCRMYTTGTMGCVSRLMSGDADIAINWYGGMSHARSSSAYGGCYVNDVVLAILMLLRKYQRVFFISLDGEHCDAVEEAFYESNQVLTLSFHCNPEKGTFPATGHVDDIGIGQGEGYAVNVPLDDGANDRTLMHFFDPIIKKIKANFKPEVIVFQSGGSLLPGDRFSKFNVSSRGIGECLKRVRDFNVPLLCLGGSGTNMAITSKLWAYETVILTNSEDIVGFQHEKKVMDSNGDSKDDILIPQETTYREYFGPEYTLHVHNAIMENEMTYSTSNSFKKKILDRLNKFIKPTYFQQ
eukprot:CAMPEP_0204864662 /NCGR_PEP_ID=MMETSP1348-20121228/4213_1 /ASSEMBLY_ACC=CAM_ASM_000700 /TAXON_ID=215587 /ORGANISM="Aplanochytrium stocchinoi, Strain GSBS06" /LENGTH=528 /DNA_ID=CAMNT_0052015345 /DNA_START=173 /DNA_END=1759 /DNA_ORIENTATION=-